MIEDKDVIKQLENKFDKIVEIFENIFPSHSDKITFLQLCNQDKSFIDKDDKYQDIKNAINVLVENARVDMTRKCQQQKLMPIITLISSDKSIEEINKVFLNDQYAFSLFCLIHIAFLYEKSLNEHGAKYHSHMIIALENCSKAIIEFNK